MSTDIDAETTEKNNRPSANDGSEASGAARLRDQIDRGAGGDKVPFMDPAAAPLGTDAEAAGTPPSAAEVATAMDYEADRSPAANDKKGPADLQGAASRQKSWFVIVGFFALVALVIALFAA